MLSSLFPLKKHRFESDSYFGSFGASVYSPRFISIFQSTYFVSGATVCFLSSATWCILLLTNMFEPLSLFDGLINTRIGMVASCVLGSYIPKEDRAASEK